MQTLVYWTKNLKDRPLNPMFKNANIFLIKFTIIFIWLSVDDFFPWYRTMRKLLLKQMMVQLDLGLACIVIAQNVNLKLPNFWKEKHLLTLI